jgi:hypothetical protein
VRTATKCVLVVALALAATALAAGPAYATTIAEVGDAAATQDGSSNLANGVISITCTSSDETLTFQNSGATTIDALTFGGCVEDFTSAPCTVLPSGLPQSAQINWVATTDATSGSFSTQTTPTAVGTLTPETFFVLTIDCGGLTCIVQVDGNLTYTLSNSVGGAPGRKSLAFQGVAVSGDAGCGVGMTTEWNISWTIYSTSGGADTRLTITE